MSMLCCQVCRGVAPEVLSAGICTTAGGMQHQLSIQGRGSQCSARDCLAMCCSPQQQLCCFCVAMTAGLQGR